MTLWKHGSVTLACEELRERVKGKKIALMMNTSALDNEGRLLIDRIADKKWATIAFFLGMEHGVRGNLYAADSNLAKQISARAFPWSIFTITLACNHPLND